MPFPVGTWRSLVAYLNGVQGVVGSNLTVPTTHSKWVSCGNPGARNGRRMNVPENEPKEPRSITLLLHCPLRLGLAAGLTQFIYTHGGRILYHEQYVDSDGDHYYTRLKWDVSSFSTTDAEMAERLRALIGSGLETEWSLHNSDQVLRMAVFVSKDPWCLYDILARSGSGEWMVEVPVIVSNHADDDRHLDHPLPGAAAREDVIETPRVLRHKDGHPKDLVRVMERPLGLKPTANQGSQPLGHLRVCRGEARDVPLEARVVMVAVTVDVLLVVENAPSVGVDELGQTGGQAETEGAMQQQGDRPGLLWFVLGNVHSPSVPCPRVPTANPFRMSGRDGGIRTHDPLNPIQVRYQAAPRPDRERHRRVVEAISGGSCL